jgi:acylphosphatase
LKRLLVTVRGRVQGVGYRAFAAEQAGRRQLMGWVKNDWDGSVQVVAEGDETALGSFLQALREGPSLARVEGVAATWEPAQNNLSPFIAR